MASKWDFVRLVMYWNKVGYGVSNGESLRELVSTEYFWDKYFFDVIGTN